MMELTDEQASVLKQGYPVGVLVPELGGDVIVVLEERRRWENDRRMVQSNLSSSSRIEQRHRDHEMV
jgi:hypothetical protein